MRRYAHCLLTTMLALSLTLGSNPAFGQKGQPHDPNPKNDPDVQRGYDKHQKWYHDKENKDKENKKVKKKKQSVNTGVRG